MMMMMMLTLQTFCWPGCAESQLLHRESFAAGCPLAVSLAAPDPGKFLVEKSEFFLSGFCCLNFYRCAIKCCAERQRQNTAVNIPFLPTDQQPKHPWQPFCDSTHSKANRVPNIASVPGFQGASAQNRLPWYYRWLALHTFGVFFAALEAAIGASVQKCSSPKSASGRGEEVGLRRLDWNLSNVGCQ